MPIFLQAVLAQIRKRPWILAIVALLIVCGYLAIRTRTLAFQRDEARLQVRDLSSRIEEQNRAVENWRAAAEEQAALVTSAELRAARLRANSTARVAKILSEPIPLQCDNAVRWGAAKGIDLGKAWEAGR